MGASAISILVALASMLAASLVIRQQHLEESNSMLRKASSIIEKNLNESKANLLSASRQLATQKNIGSTIWYLGEYAQANTNREILLSTYNQLTKDVYNIGRVAKLSRIAIYDSSGHLVTFAIFEGNKNQVGIVERSSAPKFLVATLTDNDDLNGSPLNATDSVITIAPEFGMRLPQQEKVYFADMDGMLAIECTVPIMGNIFDPNTGKQVIKQLGLIRMVQKFNQAFVDHLSQLTDTKINVFTQHGFSIGSLTSYRNPNWNGTQPRPDSQSITLNEIDIKGDGYYQSLIPIYKDKQLLGTFAVLHSKEIVQKVFGR